MTVLLSHSQQTQTGSKQRQAEHPTTTAVLKRRHVVYRVFATVGVGRVGKRTLSFTFTLNRKRHQVFPLARSALFWFGVSKQSGSNAHCSHAGCSLLPFNISGT